MSIMATNTAAISRYLKLLNDELSIAMLRVLVDGPATCMELARRLQCKQSRAWKRLEVLREAGLVQRLARQGYKGSALYIALKDKVSALFDGFAQIMQIFTQDLPG